MTDPGGFFLAMAPHLIGSFLGTLLISIAWIRSGFPRTPAILLLAFLMWDFMLSPIGPLEPHLLLILAWGWMGIYLIRMPDAVWRGSRPLSRRGAPQEGQTPSMA